MCEVINPNMKLRTFIHVGSHDRVSKSNFLIIRYNLTLSNSNFTSVSLALTSGNTAV